jgi:riboflavin synthase
MFTGIITAIGTVRSANRTSQGLNLVIECPYEGLTPGESVAVDGACLTVQTAEPGRFTAQVIGTSLERTRFAGYQPGQRVNLERALRVGDRLGGHMVQGHVDGVGIVERVTQQADARMIDIRAPAEVIAVSVPLGSVTVDGVSLTINALPATGVIQISLIPFTLQHTTLGERAAGDPVHLEGDAFGKYVAGMKK